MSMYFIGLKISSVEKIYWIRCFWMRNLVRLLLKRRRTSNRPCNWPSKDVLDRHLLRSPQLFRWCSNIPSKLWNHDHCNDQPNVSKNEQKLRGNVQAMVHQEWKIMFWRIFTSYFEAWSAEGRFVSSFVDFFIEMILRSLLVAMASNW